MTYPDGRRKSDCNYVSGESVALGCRSCSCVKGEFRAEGCAVQTTSSSVALVANAED